MRIDRLLSEAGVASRKEAAKAARCGLVSVDGQVVTDLSRHIDPALVTVVYDGKAVDWRPFVYVMLNKPQGYVSATEDGHLPTVVELLSPALQKRSVFPCGRLDRDTTGLMLITDDGALSHLLLSPRRHVSKVYRFACAEPLCPEAERAFEEGMILGNGDALKGARLVCDPLRTSGTVELTEGKYHQVKRMFGALSNRITELERITFGPLSLDPALGRGDYRELTADEVEALRQAVAG